MSKHSDRVKHLQLKPLSGICIMKYCYMRPSQSINNLLIKDDINFSHIV